MARGPTVGINITAGTAELFVQMKKAGTTVEDFANKAKKAGMQSGAGFVGGAAAVRVMEGNLNSNVRAIARFMTQTLKLGPIINAAFPIIGGFMFMEMLGQSIKKLEEFHNKIKYAGENIRASFQPGINSLQSVNDDLGVQLAKLNQDIDKLLGKRENGLALALAEAIKFVDELNDHIGSAMEKMSKLLQEKNIGKLESLFTGQARTTDIGRYFAGVSGVGGANEEIRQQRLTGRGYVEEAQKTKGTETQVKAAIDAAVKRADDELAGLIKVKLDWVADELKKRTDAAKPKTVMLTNIPLLGMPGGQVGERPVQTPGENETSAIEKLKAAQSELNEMLLETGQSSAVYKATVTKQKLERDAETQSLTKAYTDRIAMMKAEHESLVDKFKSVGATQAETVALEAQGEALKIIAELQKKIETPGAKKQELTAAQKKNIFDIAASDADVKLETQWKESLLKTTNAANQRIASLGLLTAAIGQGYEATKKAVVQTQVMAEVEAHANDAVWLHNKAQNIADITKVRSAEYDAEYNQRAKETLHTVGEQIKAEHNLAAAYLIGADAAAQAALQNRINEINLQHTGEAARQLIAQQVDLYNINKVATYNKELRSLNDETAKATDLLRAEAVNQSDVAKARAMAKIQTMHEQLGNGPETQGLETQIYAIEAKKYAQEQLKAAMDVKSAYATQIEQLQFRNALLVYGNEHIEKNVNLAYELKANNTAILQLTKDQAVEEAKAFAGIKAFFMEVKEKALSTNKELNDILLNSLRETESGVADQLGKAATGQKTGFGKMAQGIGQKAVSGAIQVGMDKVLSKIPGFGPKAAQKVDLAPLFTDTQPGKVFVTNMPKDSSPGSGGSSPMWGGSTPIWGAASRGFSSMLGSLLGGGGNGASGSGAGSTPDVSSTISYPGMAAGGYTTPDKAYMVGENGPEILAGVSGRILSNSQSRRVISSSNGASVYYSIDARGTDPVLTDARVRASIVAAHNNAIQSAVRVNSERMFRTPRGTGRQAAAR
jgi:hypothetical protein